VEIVKDAPLAKTALN